MAIPFLNHLDVKGNITLNDYKLQDFVVDHSTTGDAGDTAGKLIYDSGTLKYYDGSSWQSLGTSSGSMSQFILEDDDGTEVSISNNEEIKFIGSGITTNWTDTSDGSDGDPFDLTFTIDAAQTGITSLLATDIKIGEDDQTKIDFETADEIHFYAANVEQVYLGDNIFGPQSDSDVDLGSSSVRWKDAYVDSITVTGEVDGASLDISGNADIDGTLEADAITVGGTTLQVVVEDHVGAMLDGTETGISVSYDATDNNLDFVVSDTTVAGDSGSTGITPGDTLTIAGGTGCTTAMSGDTLTITNSVTNTDVDVSNANLLTRLAALESSGGASDENITIGADSGDTIVITGNLQVSGTTTTVNSTTVNLNDHNIVLDSGNSTSAVVNGAGITLEGGSGDDATITYSTTGPQFELKLGSAYEDLQIAKLTATELDISGDIDVDGTANLDVVDIDGAVDMASNLTLAGNADFNGNLDVDGTTNLDVVDIDGAVQIDATVTVGVDDTGYDVKFFGDTASKYMLWDASADTLVLTGELDAGSLDVSGNADIDGTLEADAITVNGTALNTVIDNRIKVVQKTATIDVSSLVSNVFKCNIAHSMSSNNLIVKLYDGTTFLDVFADVDRTDANTLQITFASQPSNDIVVVIQEVIGDNIAAGSNITYPSS